MKFFLSNPDLLIGGGKEIKFMVADVSSPKRASFIKRANPLNGLEVALKKAKKIRKAGGSPSIKILP